MQSLHSRSDGARGTFSALIRSITDAKLLAIPGIVAHYTKDLVYARLAPDILQELEKRNPLLGNRRAVRHHQHLTDEIGCPALDKHLYTVIKFMEAAETWDDLMRMIDRALPRLDEAIQLDLLEWARTAGLTE